MKYRYIRDTDTFGVRRSFFMYNAVRDTDTYGVPMGYRYIRHIGTCVLDAMLEHTPSWDGRQSGRERIGQASKTEIARIADS
uniref:Uncharacterized protein n=1 Tax=Romanomermis culicivorax TaxID=13658 RepID=A0A915HMH7_ROMCU